MIQETDLDRLKRINKVERTLHRQTSILNRDLVMKLIDKIRMLQKQKKYLQAKLREKCNITKEPKE